MKGTLVKDVGDIELSQDNAMWIVYFKTGLNNRKNILKYHPLNIFKHTL